MPNPKGTRPLYVAVEIYNRLKVIAENSRPKTKANHLADFVLAKYIKDVELKNNEENND